MTLTLGTQFQVDANGDDRTRFAGLTGSTGIALYSSAAGGVEARHLTNTGGTITGGAVLTIDANQAAGISICRLTASTALVGYAYGATHRVRILSVSGTTLTANAITNMTDTGVTFIDCKLLDTDKVIYVYSNSALDGVSRVLTISGTTVTENAAFTYYNAANAYHNVVDIYSTIQVIVLWGNPQVRGELLDISGTTITGNTEEDAGASHQVSTGGDHQLGVARQETFPDFVTVVSCNNANNGRRTNYENQGGGTLNQSGTSLLTLAGVPNSVDIDFVCSDGATFDQNIIILNDTTGPNLQIDELPWSGSSSDTDTSVSTVAGTNSCVVGLLPGSSTCIGVWDATTESITISIDSCPAATLALAPMTKPADIDAAGEFIYLALLDSGTPILTKISTDLDADGTTVFNPGAGDNIGVECGRFNSDVVWVAGQFDGTNVVEKSEDGGSTFTVKDDATIGGVRSFVMGPDSDDKILLFDEDNGDILETRDSGASWTTVNASVTPEINSIARLGENVQESVFGNAGAANDNVDYSVNSGDDLEDFNLPVNENVTRVIAN
jgi:hypothetical protein